MDSTENAGLPGVAQSVARSVSWHRGNPFAEQRAASSSAAVVDQSDRDVIVITGPDKLTWLHTLVSQDIASLNIGHSVESLILDANGRVEYHFVVSHISAQRAPKVSGIAGDTEDGVLLLDTEPGYGSTLSSFLTTMVFWSKVTVTLRPDLGVTTLIGPRAGALLHAGDSPLTVSYLDEAVIRSMPTTPPMFDLIAPVDSHWYSRLSDAGATPAGTWTLDAHRVNNMRPIIGIDTDDRTIPHEVRWIGDRAARGAVHLDKGCYRGQETVARVHNLGKPPRRMVLLHLDGSDEKRPSTGDTISVGGRVVGRIGTVVDDADLGPIALALVKRTVPTHAELMIGDITARIDADTDIIDETIPVGRAAIARLRQSPSQKTSE